MSTRKKKSQLLSAMFTFHSEEMVQIYKLRAYLSLVKFENGIGDTLAWCNVLAQINIGHDMATNYFTKEVADFFSEAVSTLAVSFIIGETTSKFTMTKNEIDLIGYALTLTDDMQAMITNREYQKSFTAASQVNIPSLIKRYEPAEMPMAA